MSKFVTAYNRRGEPQTIPAKWLAHPTIGSQFTTEPPATTPEETPANPEPPTAGDTTKGK